jgi:hypothetical protein
MKTLMLMFSKNWGGIDSARPAPRSSTSLWLPKNAPGIFVEPEDIVKSISRLIKKPRLAGFFN